MAFAKYIESIDNQNNNLYEVKTKEQIISFLDTKIKNQDEDPDKRWITTWNDYLGDIKYFFRWLYNFKEKNETSISDWQTPSFAQIKKKKTKRLSPYLETELWDREELATIIKYESNTRNKAILALMWDLDARNHEITLLKIKHIRILEKYGEGEIPHEAKTGSGPVLLTFSFLYTRDWLNEHPFSNNPDARLICNLHNGAPVKPEAIWLLMKRLRQKIKRMLDTGSIKDIHEKTRIENLLKTKKWNPYCIRHSAITADSDYLPEYALKKKVRWSMNSRQGNRYIKSRMGNELKNKILEYNGIFVGRSIKQKPIVMECPRCEIINRLENKYCSKCGYPLKPEAYDEIKINEEKRIQNLETKMTLLMESQKEILECLKYPEKLSQIT